MHDLLRFAAVVSAAAESIRRSLGVVSELQHRQGRTAPGKPGKNRDKVRAARKQRRKSK